jgi:hypothetical protein
VACDAQTSVISQQSILSKELRDSDAAAAPPPLSFVTRVESENGQEVASYQRY